MDLYDISPQEFYIEKEEFDEDGNYHYELSEVDKLNKCPVCGSMNIVHFGRRENQYRDMNRYGKMVGLIINKQRYRCNDCGDVFARDNYESLHESFRMTKRLYKYIQEQSLNRPFNNVAAELGITDTTVKRVFDEYIDALDRSRVLKAPRVLGIDENHLRKQYRAVFVDIENSKIIEMLKNRSKASVIKFIKSIPHYETIEIFTMDMWEPYRQAVYSINPDAVIVVDKFHVVKLIGDKANWIRRKIQNALPDREKELIKGHKKLMQTNSEDLTPAWKHRLEQIFKACPQLKEIYEIKEGLRRLYCCDGRLVAEQQFDILADRAAAYPDMYEVIETMNRWRKEIFNYFEYHYTNAPTESLNHIINQVDARGTGYSFEVLRHKILYGTSATKPARFRFKADTSMRLVEFVASFQSMEEYECVSGWGVDIEELKEALLLKKSKNYQNKQREDILKLIDEVLERTEKYKKSVSKTSLLI